MVDIRHEYKVESWKSIVFIDSCMQCRTDIKDYTRPFETFGQISYILISFDDIDT
jgi:hypothetical protein